MDTVTMDTVTRAAVEPNRREIFSARPPGRARRRASDTPLGELRAMLERRLAAVAADAAAVPTGGAGDDSYMAHCRMAATQGGNKK